uniref:Uncharacterized protein n=1 Tax=Anguilla anguilla TaxID=7936 RepID=A0A0E9U8E5_ANGAN
MVGLGVDNVVINNKNKKRESQHGKTHCSTGTGLNKKSI